MIKISRLTCRRENAGAHTNSNNRNMSPISRTRLYSVFLLPDERMKVRLMI